MCVCVRVCVSVCVCVMEGSGGVSWCERRYGVWGILSNLE